MRTESGGCVLEGGTDRAESRAGIHVGANGVVGTAPTAGYWAGDWSGGRAGPQAGAGQGRPRGLDTRGAQGEEEQEGELVAIKRNTEI
jgi:hypothetical protein